MASKHPKQPVKRGILPKLKGFMEALGDRYQQALQVIDEALRSENLKDKIWAVDLILKKSPSPEAAPEKARPEAPNALDPAAFKQLSDTELLTHIRQYLKEWEP